MLNGETEQKQSVHFFALMLALSLCMHTALCIFFYCIGVQFYTCLILQVL